MYMNGFVCTESAHIQEMYIYEKALRLRQLHVSVLYISFFDRPAQTTL